MDRSIILGFFSELEKIGATVLMKPLSSAAKATMKKMTGFGRQAKAAPAVKGFLSPGATRKSFAASRKEVAAGTSRLPGMTDAAMSDQGVKQMAGQRRQQLDQFLQRTGRTGHVPNLERRLDTISGHGRKATRTPARVVRADEVGTAAGTPSAKRSAPQAPPAAHADTQVAPARGGVMNYEPTKIVPALQSKLKRRPHRYTPTAYANTVVAR